MNMVPKQKYPKSAKDLNYRELQIKEGFEIIINIFESHLNNFKLFFYKSFLNNSSNNGINFEKRLNKRKAYSIHKKNIQNNLINPNGRRKSFFLTKTDMDKIQKEMELKRIKYHYSYIRNKSFDKYCSEESSSKKEKESSEKSDGNNNEILSTDINPNEFSFIKMKFVDDADQQIIDKSQLVEYDIFYKEQFFKDDVFKYDVNNIEDKEEKEINREINKLNIKRRLIAKKKEKEVNKLKGLDIEDLEIEIGELEKEYKKIKTIEKPKLNMIMNNTIGLLKKGRILECYFIGKREEDFPRFALESEKEIGAKEVIDFKPLRKEEQARRYFDYYICLKQRREIHKYIVYIRFYSRFLFDNFIFDNLSLLVVIINTVIILISDPIDPKNLGIILDQYFLYFYSFEAILKIISFTFISAEDAYLRDYWNILDFIVVIVGWISFIIEKLFKNTNLSGLTGLRAVRILRPLKVLRKIKGLKKLATALLASIGHLGETTIILLFVFVLFSIAGRQMWQGNFLKRCMNINYGYLYSIKESDYMCSFDNDCEELNTYGLKFICAKGYINPDSGAINFDNILNGFVTIFVMATLEGWTNVFTYVNKTFKDKVYINSIIVFFYFHFFIFFCAFYLINLFLAVTNSEFEHIESERKLLVEKKSFFQLIKTKYDLKEKEKISKKEKVKKLKESNSKKSSQSLIDLYHKVKEDAFHIHKKKRNIPILYSTIKDMYIMSNDNPEELYLQQLRIEKEEQFLSKDISKQQKEINKLIKIKKEEMKKSHKDREEEIFIKKNTPQNLVINSNNKMENRNNFLHRISLYKNSQTIKQAFSNYNIVKNEEKDLSLIEDIKKYIFKFKKDLIKDSIDRTQKLIKEKIYNLTKRIQKVENDDKENNEIRKKLEKKGKKKAEFYQIAMEEDLPYEKEIKNKNKDKKENGSKEHLKNKSNKTIKIEKEKSIKKNNHNSINDEISFMSDLSLSNSDDNFSQINKIIFNQNELIENQNYSFENKKDILFCEKKEIGTDDKKLEEKINFYRPRSLLSSIINMKNDKDIQKKIKKMEDKFDINNFIKKEENKGTNLNNLGKRRSFLNFLKYTEVPKDLENDIFSFKNTENINNNINNEFFESNNITNIDNINNYDNDLIDLNEENNENYYEKNLLNSEPSLSRNDDLSINEMGIIPQEIKDNKIVMLNRKTSENSFKTLKSNKITQKIREFTFDRRAINTNIELTTKEQSKFLKMMNKKLNQYLFSDNFEPRGRNNDELDKSHIINGNNYDRILQDSDYLEENILFDTESKNQISNNILNIKKINRFSSKKFNQKKRKNSKKFYESMYDNENTNYNISLKSTKKREFENPIRAMASFSLNKNDNNNLNNDLISSGFYIFKAKSI